MRIVYGDDDSETCVFEKGEKDEIRLYVWEVLDTNDESTIDEMTENVINRMMETGETCEEAFAWCQEFC
ncbi:hypothetical protein HF670_07740 [Acidithiobacillus thiooxidans]|uniref:hypothetical protein n=1 Tax=Acidithiobacillus thiooxidans TaxID=930 RepID=UPI001C07BF17|nr:hypothetical protein [Acidithiobacillus thiooxidans]MBU2839456.1 hypothetical protein [Acidithiobacillus thiooxidans]MBU2844034.1 hypothetical protein [Acidithiobacillus thiooxidans]